MKRGGGGGGVLISGGVKLALLNNIHLSSPTPQFRTIEMYTSHKIFFTYIHESKMESAIISIVKHIYRLKLALLCTIVKFLYQNWTGVLPINS